jgi:dTDP-4-amino-4,6-dideoxygalactose transaminase
MTIRFLDLQAQYRSIQKEVDSAISDVLNTAHFIGGPYVQEFERAFAEYQEARHCVTVGNATDGLEIALEALDLPDSSEVIVPANSFVASSEAVTRAGHSVVFADVDPSTYLLTPETVACQITPRTRAVVAVHLYGHPVDIDGLSTLAMQHNLLIVEDAAQAVGAEHRGRRVGAIADIGVFSFYPGKNLGAYGDAGAIVTNDDSLAKRARMIANHGRISKYDHEFEGRNSRLDAVQAAVLEVKLRHIESWTKRRIEVAALYTRLLTGVGDLVLPTTRQGARHVYHLFVVRTAHRDSLAKHLLKSGIETGVHYPIALPRLNAYRDREQDCTKMWAYENDRNILSLPIGEHLSDRDVERVAGAVKSFYS